jgi:threonine synthase
LRNFVTEKTKPVAMGAFASKGGANDSYVESVMDCVGNTPLIKLQRSTAPGATVLCKLEAQNPGGSVKDRIAKRMIEGAEKNNLITPGKTTIIEATSGNTGEPSTHWHLLTKKGPVTTS